MDAESFNDLVLRVLAGEATESDRRALAAELAAHPGRRDDFDQFRIAYDVSRTVAPLAEAVNATLPELPAHRLNELRTAVRQEFGPVSQRKRKKSGNSLLYPFLRWLLAGGGAAALAAFLIFVNFSDRAVEVGLYQTDTVRGDNGVLTAADIPAAHLVTFAQDTPFDDWQSRPLAWNERAKIWVDNEHDLLHIVHRDAKGHIVSESQPLASTNEAQRDQIRQAVVALQKP